MYSRRWLHSNITGQEAERLLMESGYDGSFLARPSHSVPGNFTLSVRRRNEVTHIKIQNTGDFYDLYGGDKFASLAELVQHYTEAHGQLKEKTGMIIALKYPLFTVDPTNERWFHGMISGKIAEKRLKEKARFGSYLVRASISKPGDFVLSVQGENQCTHIMIHTKNGQFEIGGGMSFESLSELIDYYKDNPMVEAKPSGNVVHLKQPFNATSITASGISNRIRELEKENSREKTAKQGYFEEFEQLGQLEGKNSNLRKEGKKEINKQKNRYKNILPFDETRVKLLEGNTMMATSGYINANHITNGDNSQSRQYIATQGCLSNTVTDFWRMVWQENACVIAMTTKLVERAKNKCEKYWPDLNCTSNFTVFNGILRVKCISEAEQDNHTVRAFTFSFLEKGDEATQIVREVWQYHFMTWPDHGAPTDPGSVLLFLQEINSKQSSLKNAGPIIVHCSAGIGRTGTIIVIDMILQQIKSQGLNSEIDVQQMVAMIRDQRSGMVQTEHQYRFIYRAVRHHIDTTMQRIHAERKSDREYKNIQYPMDIAPGSHGDLLSSASSSSYAISTPDTATHYTIPVPKANKTVNCNSSKYSMKNNHVEDSQVLYSNLPALKCPAGDAPILYPKKS